MIPAAGHLDSRGLQRNRRVVVTLDEGQYGEVRAYALRHGLSMAKAVRELLEWGMPDEPGAQL